MRYFFYLTLILTLLGCDLETARRDREQFENNAIKSVQEAESVQPGITCMKYMGDVLNIAEASNTYVKIKGWMAYKEPGHTVIIFQADQNEKPLEWKWYIEDGMVIPVNDLAQGVMKRQKAKYM